MSPAPSLIRTSPAFALISVLALVSLAALTATAFLASARLEKTAAMTIGDQTRLTLALDSGYHLASYTFTRGDNTWNWADFLVGEDADGVGYLYHAVPYAGTTAANVGQWYNYATFSCATLSNIGVTAIDPTNYSATTTWQGGFASNRLDPSSRLSKMTNFGTTDVTPNGPVTRIPLLFSRTSPTVNWITNYVTNPTTLLLTPTYRFAYFTEDLSGLIDAERMGGSSSRATGTNPNEIALGEIGLTNLPTFTNLRPMFLNPGLIESVIRTNGLSVTTNNPWRYLISGTYSLNSRLSTTTNHRQGYLKVPSGLGYRFADTNANALSTNKLNLNTLFNGGVASATAISQITAAIATNLPGFATARAGGFTNSAGGGATNTNAYTTNAYLQTLAANIIDYADTDSTPTTDGTGISTNRDRPVYRGVDSCPWVNEVSTRFVVTKTNATNIGGVNGLAIFIETTDYVELWNLCSQTNVGTLTFTAINRQDLNVGFTTLSFANPSWATNALGAAILGGVSSNSTNLTLIPNQFFVIGFPTITNFFFYQGNVPAFPWKSALVQYVNASNSYRVAWNNVYYDGALGGLRRQTKDLNLNQSKWSGTCPSLGGEDPAFFYMSGDPRAALYQSRPQQATDYSLRSSFGGRNFRGDSYPSKEVDVVRWPDSGHNSPAGKSPGSDETLPTLGPGPNYTNCPPARISNAGSYSSVLELGNIFDPIQWYDAAGTSTSSGYGSDGGQWTNLTPTAVASNAYGGGTSLRIGRAELTKFAWTNVSGQPQPNMQASAAALLDLFCADTNTDAALSGRFDDGDQININTAPPRVLRALAAGIILTNDPALRPNPSYPIPATAVDAFVKGVTNFRAKYPFYSASQLTFIGTNANWPNTNDWPAGAVFTTNGMGFSEGNDAAIEEWFSKIYALSKVNSRNYRIYVQAQLIRTRGTNTNSANYLALGAIGRRYYDVLNQQNNSAANAAPSCSVYLLRKVDY